MSSTKNVTILGAGLVGSLLSVFLRKRGYNVTIYERRADMRKEKIAAGRSINLALSDRGWRALKKVGIEKSVRKVAIPMYGRMIHAIDGSTNFQAYGGKDQAIYSVSRGGLNCVLMDEAEKHGAKIIFEQRCTGVDLQNQKMQIENADGTSSEIKSDLIVGADGAFSAVRLQLQQTNRYEYSQHYLEHGYKELTIEAGENGSHLMEKNCLHIWPRGGFMLIALPNMDGSFTCTLFFPFNGEYSFATLNTEQKVNDFFVKTFPDAFHLMKNLTPDFFNNPTGSLVTVKCFPWTYNENVMLIGDAAHAIVPFYGQGMNCGFEDCTVLDELMEQHGELNSEVMLLFENTRKSASDAIAELAVNNFIEMRDLVADKKFILQKKIEARFHEKHPDKWLPLYSMVTFSNIPYNEALKEGKGQEKIMKEIMNVSDIEEKWDSDEIEKMILKMI
jgi:kynurenine 3-monooxygenase